MSGSPDGYLDVIGQPDRAAALQRCTELLAGTPCFSIAWTAQPSGPDRLVVRQTSGVRTGLMRDLSVPAGRGLTGKVFSSTQADWVDDYFTATSITHDFDREMTGEGVRRLLAVPITAGGRTFGVLAAGSRDDGAFGDIAVAEATAAARAAAVALEIVERMELRIAGLLETLGANLASISLGAHSLAEDPGVGTRIRSHLGRIADQADAATGTLRTFRCTAPPLLTRREQEVLRRAAAGETNPEIAYALVISRNTVKDYLQQAMHKLGARNRAQAAVRARELGLL
ncbi:helix-turn-helix transcriptional regulator [Catenulispora subtropica]|uniref:HTH luxR-type domain-containing protein n=1 Tax=Catenulispora subtropica TaxID=450798 RepID=A0ABP5C982_9ACTN